jgi:CheY-like chemotaxis protein
MTTERIILCADDDEDDIDMLQEAINAADGTYRIVQAGNGIDALKQLDGLKQQGTLPCLVVLDINMPKMDGRQTFVSIRNNPDFAKIPVVILSTSSSPLDKTFFAKKDVEYITKPINYDYLVQVAQKLLTYCKD